MVNPVAACALSGILLIPSAVPSQAALRMATRDLDVTAIIDPSCTIHTDAIVSLSTNGTKDIAGVTCVGGVSTLVTVRQGADASTLVATVTF
jgi:hypothetical protein